MTVEIVQTPLLTQVNLRQRTDNPAIVAALGTELPANCSAAQSEHHRVLWLGPDEWLVLAGPGAADDLVARLRAAGAGAVTDVSAQRTTFTIHGDGARELLAKGCSIDFHPSVSPPGTCVQTLIAQTGAIIVVDEPIEGHEAFTVLVRSSFADYLRAWLDDVLLANA